MKDRLITLFEDIKSRGWRAFVIASLVVASILSVAPEAKWLGKFGQASIGFIALIYAYIIITKDTNRSIRSTKGAVYGSIIFATLWVTVAIETLQRFVRGTNNGNDELIPLAVATIFVLLFFAAGLATGMIGRYRTHVKGMPNKELFK